MQRGERVLAWWPAENDWWYAGVVCESLANGDIEIQYDDCQRSVLKADQVRPLAMKVGMRVFARWQGGANYYPGQISTIEGNAMHVQYDDGDQEWCTVSAFRVHRNDL